LTPFRHQMMMGPGREFFGEGTMKKAGEKERPIRSAKEHLPTDKNGRLQQVTRQPNPPRRSVNSGRKGQK